MDLENEGDNNKLDVYFDLLPNEILLQVTKYLKLYDVAIFELAYDRFSSFQSVEWNEIDTLTIDEENYIFERKKNRETIASFEAHANAKNLKKLEAILNRCGNNILKVKIIVNLKNVIVEKLLCVLNKHCKNVREFAFKVTENKSDYKNYDNALSQYLLSNENIYRIHFYNYYFTYELLEELRKLKKLNNFAAVNCQFQLSRLEVHNLIDNFENNGTDYYVHGKYGIPPVRKGIQYCESRLIHIE